MGKLSPDVSVKRLSPKDIAGATPNRQARVTKPATVFATCVVMNSMDQAGYRVTRIV